MRGAIAAGLGAWLAIAQGARAERVGAIVVAAADPPFAPAALDAALARANRARGLAIGDGLAAARARRAGGAVVGARLERFVRAEALVDEAWKAYLGVRPGLAVDRLREARAIGIELLDLDGGVALVADVALRLGAVELAEGHADAAGRELALAARLAPARAVTDTEFTPEVVAAYDAARALATTAPLAIATDPPGATLTIDGAPGGRAPATVELATGWHAVVARTPDATRAVLVDVGAQAELRVALDPDPAAAALIRGVRAGDAPGATGVALAAIATYAELDAIWLIGAGWRRGVPTLLGQRCADRPVRCGAVVEVAVLRGAALDAAARALVGELLAPRPLLVRPEVARLAGAEARPRPVAGARPLWRRPWFWLGAAGVAAAATTIAILARDTETRPVVEVDPDDFKGP